MPDPTYPEAPMPPRNQDSPLGLAFDVLQMIGESETTYAAQLAMLERASNYALTGCCLLYPSAAADASCRGATASRCARSKYTHTTTDG